jgi:T-complex protein 1 subunit eta
MLEVFAGTALNSKLISNQKDLFAPMVVDAISMLDPELLDLNLVGVKKVPGGSVTQSFLVPGVAFKKTFSYAGFEQMTKSFTNPKILLLNVELELKSEKENAEVRISDPSMYQSIVDAEWSIIYEKLDFCVASGAQIILSKLPIGDLATQYFADRGLFCAGRVEAIDMTRVAKATGGKIQSSVNDLTPDVLGEAGKFSEDQVGDERFNIFTGCPHAKTATIILRGGSEQFIEESHRSIHDALCIVKRGLMSRQVVAGGGAIEMDVSKALKEHARGISGKQQHIVGAFAKALEVVPRQLCENAGFDPTNVLQQLRAAHAAGPEGKWMGVDLDSEGVVDTMKASVWEPAINKINSYSAATEAACVILSIDETVRNAQSEQPGAASGGLTMQQQQQKMAAAMGGRGGRGGGSRNPVRRLK